MLRLRYAILILLKRSQHLSNSILGLTWEQESTAFQDMIMLGKCIRVRICQYFPILDDLYQKLQWREDTWQKSNLDILIIMCYLIAMN
jgi:hypothetical protein